MIRAFAIIVFGTLLLAAVLTPPIFSALEYFMSEMSWRYSRVHERVAMLVLLGLIVLMRRDFPLPVLSAYYRPERWRQEWQPLLAGIGLTVMLSLSVLPLMVHDERLDWADRAFAQYALKVMQVAPGALVISILEESVFRALIFRRLRASVALPFAVALCSLVYAMAHFMTPAEQWQYPGYSMTVGFEYLGAVFDRLLLPGALEVFVGLFLVGVVLCLIVWRTGSLLLCIGLHTGWVIAMKLASFSTEKTANFVYLEGVGRLNFLLAEPLVWVSILLVGFIVMQGFTRVWPSVLHRSGAP